MQISMIFVAISLALVWPAYAGCTFGVQCSYGPDRLMADPAGGRAVLGGNATINGIFPVSISAAVLPKDNSYPFRLALLPGSSAWPPTLVSAQQYLPGSYYVGVENKVQFDSANFQVFFDLTSLYKLYPFHKPNKVVYYEYMTKASDQPNGCSGDMGTYMLATYPEGSWQAVYPDGSGNGQAWYLRWNGPLDKVTGLIQSGSLYQDITPTWTFYQHYNSTKLTITRMDPNRPCSAVYIGSDNPQH